VFSTEKKSFQSLLFPQSFPYAPSNDYEICTVAYSINLKLLQRITLSHFSRTKTNINQAVTTLWN